MFLSCPGSSLSVVPSNAMLFPDRVRARWYYESGQLVNSTLVRHLVDEVLVPGRVLVDVGSFVGAITVGCGKSEKVSRVYSFEPNPRCHACLVANVGFAGLQDKVVCYREALSAGFGVSDWFMRSEDGFGNGIRVLLPGRCESLRAWDTVPVRPLDSYENITNVGCLVVDVNGAELDVLRGAEKVILQDLPVLVFTSWGIYKRPHVPAVKEMRDELFEYLRSLPDSPYQEPVPFGALPDVFIVKPKPASV